MEDKNDKQFKTFFEMLQALPDDRSCREYLEDNIWVDGVSVCPHCKEKSERHYKLKEKQVFNGTYKCYKCLKKFSVLTNTLFHGSHIPLRKWFIAMFIFSAHKKGVSSHQLGKDLGITQKSAWFMLSRLRGACAPEVNPGMFTGTTSCDESLIGGKNKNRHNKKKVRNAQGRSTKDKKGVFGLINNGTVVVRTIPDTSVKTLQPIIRELVETGSILITDDWTGYYGINKDYEHKVVNHRRKEYVSNGFSTNNVENFWSHLKRGLYGVYHRVSPKHLQRYCDEFSYRYNTKGISETDRFDLIIQKTQNVRLKYKTLISKA